MKRLSLTSIALSVFLAASIHAQSIQRPVPFTLSTRDTMPSAWLPQVEAGPAGKHGVAHRDADGHVIASDGTPLRFFGTEIQWTANFQGQESARTFARRIHKLGFNALRLLYYDYWGYDPYTLFRTYNDKGQVYDSSYVLNPAQLAKFDTLLYELKQAGIYVFLPISAYHPFSYNEGVYQWDSLYPGNSALGQFLNPGVENLQHRWIRTLLGHVNPLTGLAIGSDPSIACYELEWENTLRFYWQLNRLNYVDTNNALSRGLYTISWGQSRRLDTLYSNYLRNKYGSDAGLQLAWTGGNNFSSRNLLTDGSFEQFDNTSWTFVATSPAKAAASLFSPGRDSQFCELIHISAIDPNSNASYVYYLNTTGRIAKDSLFAFSFWAKVRYDAQTNVVTRPIVVYAVDQNGTPDLTSTVSIDTTWRHFSFPYRGTATGVATAGFLLGNALGDVMLDGVSLQRTAEPGLAGNESLNTSTVKRITIDSIRGLAPQRVRDQSMFYDALARSVYSGMDRLIHDTLKAVGLINNSQSNYWGEVQDFHAVMDEEATEHHTGWDYVSADAKGVYNDSSWMVRNTPMVTNTNPGAIGATAASTQVGKTALLGGYSVPSANQFATEHAVIVPSYASFQAWDAVFFTQYASRAEELFSDTIVPGYPTYAWNDIAANHAFMALMPFASKVFREGMIPTATRVDTVLHDPDDVWLSPIFADYRPPFGTEGYLYMDAAATLKLRQRYDAGRHVVAAQYPFLFADTSYTEDSSLVWDQMYGRFTATTPRLNAFTGLLHAGDSVTFPHFSLERLDDAHDILSLYYLSSSDTGSLERTGMLAFATRTQNSEMLWQKDSLSYGNHYGHAPTIMNGANMRFRFHSNFDSVSLQPLDSVGRLTGNPIAATRSAASNWFTVNLDQQATGAVWYVVREKSSPLAVGDAGGAESLQVALAPNPASSSVQLEIESARQGSARRGSVRIAIIDDLGRVVLDRGAVSESSSRTEVPLDVHSLAAGHYFVRIALDGETIVRSLNVVR